MGPGCNTSAREAAAASRPAFNWKRAAYAARSISSPASRSRCMRSIITASQRRRTAWRSRSIATPALSCSASSGKSSTGPQSTTRAPSRGSSIALERATRECRMSPTIAIVFPASVCAVNAASSSPQASSMVRKSSSACEGCSCMPSPAFSTGSPVDRASSSGAPELLERRMMHSAPSARNVTPVSCRLSPFSMEELLSETKVVVAPSDLAASSKLVRVRVLDS